MQTVKREPVVGYPLAGSRRFGLDDMRRGTKMINRRSNSFTVALYG